MVYMYINILYTVIYSQSASYISAPPYMTKVLNIIIDTEILRPIT